MEKKIYELYTNPSAPGSFLGISGFKRNNKSLRRVDKVLKSLPEYTQHKSIKYKFPRRQTVVDGIDEEWQCDLVDVSNISGSNSNHKFILTCIDVFSKEAWAEAMLNKTSNASEKAFRKIFKSSGRRPKIIFCDDGNEFKGSCKKLFDELNIRLIIAKSKNKAAIVERFNRTLREKMYRYFTFKKNSKSKKTNLHDKRYIDVLQDSISSYNNTYHRSIKTTPNSVNKQSINKTFFNLYGYSNTEGYDDVAKIEFKKGSYVRVVKKKTIFEKSSTAGWSDKIFIVNKIIADIPMLYGVQELTDTSVIDVEKLFYAQELQKIELSYDIFEIITDSKNKIVVEQLNTENPFEKTVEKQDFLKNRLRPRK